VRSENPYTLYDMYNVLIHEEKRWNFANSLQRENVDLGESGSGELSHDIKQYSRRIAQMDEEEVDPVVRRLQDWAESPISKEIVAHRHSTVNIDRAVEQGKIILLKNSVEDREIKRVISTAIMRRVWVAIQARSDVLKEKDRTPYFAFIDEFDDVVSEDMEIDKMLSKARSGKMSVCLACQNPSQIRDNHEGILKQIFANTETMVSFAVTEPEDGRLIADRMGEEFSYRDLMAMEQYRIVSRITHADEYGPTVSDALGIYTLPDYPPLRREEEAMEAKERSLDKYGVKPMKNYPGETDMLISGGGLQEQTVVKFLELVWNEQHRLRTDTVHVEQIQERFERVVGDPLESFPKGVGIPKEMVEVHNVSFDEDEGKDPFKTDDGFNQEEMATDGAGQPRNSENQKDKIAFKTENRIHIQKPTAEVSITGAGIEAVLKQDSGRNQPTAKHREMICQGFRWFSRIGFYTKVPVQTGENEVCDAEANLPINRQLSISELQDAIRTFEKENELAAEISGTANINIEAEGSTQRKPARTIKNVLRAYKNGKKAMIIVRDGRMEGRGRTYNANMVENILTNPPYYREKRAIPPGVDPQNIDEENAEPVRHLYNKTEKLNVGNPSDNQEKFALLPKGSQTTWIDSGEKLILYDGITPEADKKGEVEYSETDFASSNAMNVWCRYDEYQEEWVVYPGSNETFRYGTKKELKQEWQFVYKPLLMDQEVDELPARDDWEILILPDTDALNRDPQSPEEQDTSVTPEEESYEFDPYFPKSEVPLIYDDGKTEPLIPRDEENMFTAPREADAEDADSDAETQDRQATPDEIMSSFDQIRLEEETREVIKGYKKDHGPNDLKRIDEIERQYGAKSPAEIKTWRTVWDDFNIDYNAGIPESYLPDAIMGALGLTEIKAKDAVTIGKEFDLLIEADPLDEVVLEYGDGDDTILRLVLPEERPDLYCEDVEQYADRNKWAKIWETLDWDASTALNKNHLIKSCERFFDISSEAEAKAVIKVGVMSDSIQKGPNGFLLCSERPETYWLEIWDDYDNEYEDYLSKQHILLSISTAEGVNRKEAEDILKGAIDRGEIYAPEDADNDHYAINDPATDEGPEISRKLGAALDDDDDDDTSGDQAAPETNGQTPDGSVNTGEEGASNASTENGTAEATGDSSPEGQTADSTTSTPDQETTAPETTQSTADQNSGQANNAENQSTTQSVDGVTEPTETENQQADTGAETDEGPSHTKEELIEEHGKKPLEAEIAVNPPDGKRIKAAMGAAIEFFHQQLDEKISENVEWNEKNPNAPYRKPETPREYFQHPKYDDDPAAAYSVDNRTDLLTTDDGEAVEYEISKAASNKCSWIARPRYTAQ